MTNFETELAQTIKDAKFDDKGEVNESGSKTIKDFYEDLKSKQEDYDAKVKAFEEAEEGESKTKAEDACKESKEAWKDAKTAYETARRKLTERCMVKIGMAREDAKRAKFSKAVKEYRHERSVADREKEIRDLEAEIDVIQLNVDEQNKKIEEIRGTAKAAG